ncbi:MAG: recombinase family protein, partial [Pseudomonadota bacterium]
MTVSERFHDEAMSGASMMRPGLQSLLERCRDTPPNVVITEALDRLSRDQADIAQIFRQLVFAGVPLITCAEGEITELHVGLKGTMNQLFLKDLAAKTRRGLRGRVAQGKSGGGLSYGYRVVHALTPSGDRVTGAREIIPEEAEIIRRVFQEFADGHSPKAIARRLNSEGIPGPRGKLWRDTAIRGHRHRGTGLLNNELYIGRLVWNRMRYVKDPETGRRVSRMNDQSEWLVTEVPELRILPDALWQAVKDKQLAIEASPRTQAIKASRFWEQKRPKHLLSGLIRCGCCGGSVIVFGAHYACSHARKLRTCDQTQGVKRAMLEELILDALKTRLMQADAVKAFDAAYREHAAAQSHGLLAKRDTLQKRLTEIERQNERLLDQILNGLSGRAVLNRLAALEAESDALTEELASVEIPQVALHPNASGHYRQHVEKLADLLSDPQHGMSAR